MRVLKLILKSTFAKLGYEIKRSKGRSVRFENFENLVLAFKYLFDKDNIIKPNNLRCDLLARLSGTLPAEAFFIIQTLFKTMNEAGDICEFGVAEGETSALIANEILHMNNKILHLFDSFQGLPSPSEKDKLIDDFYSLKSMKAYKGLMSFPEDMVRARLKAVKFPEDRFVIHNGFIEKLINTDNHLPSMVSFAYVDFDFYEPIKIALDFLHKVSNVGSIFIVDDYDFFSSGAKTAVEEFITEMESNNFKYDCFVPDKNLGHFAILTRVE